MPVTRGAAALDTFTMIVFSVFALTAQFCLLLVQTETAFIYKVYVQYIDFLS